MAEIGPFPMYVAPTSYDPNVAYARFQANLAARTSSAGQSRSTVTESAQVEDYQGVVNLSLEQHEKNVAGLYLLSDSERAAVLRLQMRDSEVRANGVAAFTSAGELANGAPRFQYTTGPDGKQYAVSGHMSISTRRSEAPDVSTDALEQGIVRPGLATDEHYRVAAELAEIEAEAAEDQEGALMQMMGGQMQFVPATKEVINEYGKPSSTPPGSFFSEYA